ncbi:ABC transporter ATP-binding protein [Halalkalibacter akibai]|uniref:Lipid A export ATP-binding/permease protein MsbA n=1 Tax=Halalkalibacter akibai (strain ATCC 43226 / DSM 21942 / CIP 109018 / JCM 9157 / 1139) TaxID=1236973 RepID=W4QUY7_HALA3|nr:ABC transporter ATP-binding protein [Halalkalibacter akibai]GAE35945.1 lipid A export ATP-binding/permease protein MsbA [Halalkalibacter akibai JCM 9157]
MKDIIYFLKQIHEYAGKRLYINMFAMMLIGLLDGVGILLLIPMIAMTGIVDMDATGTPVAGLFGFLQEIPNVIGLEGVLVTFVLIVILQNIVNKQITVRNSKIQHGFFRNMRVETYNLLLHANWKFFIKNRKSDLINFLTAEIARSSAGTHSFLQFLASLIFTFIQIVLAFWLSPSITSFVLICGLFLLFFNRKFLKRSIELGSRNFSLGREFLGGITDQINGIKDIKSNALEASRMEWFNQVTKRMETEHIEYTVLKTTSQLYYKIASAVLIAGFIYIAVQLFNAQAAQLMLIIVIFSRLWPRVAGIQGSLEQIATTLPSFKAVKALQNDCRSAREFEDFNQGNITPMEVHKRIECQEIFFCYNDSSYALKNINLSIPANKMTAFVGRSGAGKSTLIDLLMGLNQPEKGQVLIDGIPLTNENLISLRRAISYVPQDPFLFNSSIRENLELVVPDASEAAMWEALEFSSAAEFVRKLPEGLDSVIGDRGIKLSGGERQRLVLARAILRRPSILVLDEATSALDTENEAKIQKALERLKGKMTIIVIAHRLSTIRNADQVVVLNDGEIIQRGGFKQLAEEKKSTFSHLLQNQLEATP